MRKIRPLMVLSILLASVNAVGQTQKMPLPPGFVDGAKSPDLIPEAAAYRLIFMHLSSLEGSNPKFAARRDFTLGQIGLTAEDGIKLRTAARSFGQQYSAWKAQLGAGFRVSQRTKRMPRPWLLPPATQFFVS